MGSTAKWLIGFMGTWIVLAALAETDDGGQVSAAMAAVIATSATFALLPDDLSKLQEISK